jgi:hypothetical protein
MAKVRLPGVDLPKNEMWQDSVFIGLNRLNGQTG